MSRNSGQDYIHEVKQGLRELRKFTITLNPIAHTLEKIDWDKSKKKEGYTIYGIVDFRDINRYLHPLLDFTAFQDPKKYYPEQMALQYLFSSSPFKLIFISEYAFEYRVALEYAKQRLSEIDINTAENIKKRLVKADELITESTKKMQSRKKMDKAEGFSKIASTEALDIAFKDARERIWNLGQKELNKLYKRNVIIDAHNLTDINKTDLSPKQNSELKKYQDRMDEVRPKRKQTNIIDAEAFYISQQLNKTYYGSRKIFLFISSAYKVREAYDTIEAIENVLDIDLLKAMGGITVVRDPQYFLLRFLLERSKKSKNILKLDELLDLSRRFKSVASRLKKYFDISESLSFFDIIDHKFIENFEKAVALKNELLPSIKTITGFLLEPTKTNSLSVAVNKRIDLKPILKDIKITPQVIRNRIEKVLSNPGQLLNRMTLGARKLAKVINSVEIKMVNILFEQDKSDMIYRMSIDKSKDKYLYNKANEICNSLCKETEYSFKKAFKHLAELRTKRPMESGTLVLTSKVFRAARSYREALQYALLVYRRDANSFEILFELAVSYQKIATMTQNYALLPEAWKYSEMAFKLERNNPRALKVKAFLLWYSYIDRWDDPYGLRKSQLLTKIISICIKALDKAKNEPIADRILIPAILNDLAYYYSLKDTISSINKGIALMKQCLNDVSKYKLRKRGAYYDTRGCLLMRKYILLKKKNPSLLYEAFDFILAGTKVDPNNLIRKENLSECLELIREHRESEK